MNSTPANQKSIDKIFSARLDLWKPAADRWFGGSLGITDLDSMMSLIAALRGGGDGYLAVEWNGAGDGTSGKSLMTVNGGKIQTAALRLADAPDLEFGMPALKKVIAETTVKESRGSIFFHQADPADFAHLSAEKGLNVCATALTFLWIELSDKN